MYWACVNVFLPKKKTKLGHSRPEATWMYCSTYCSIVSLLLLVPLADNFSQNLSPSLLSIFVSHIEYSMFKTFSAGRHTWQYKFWIKFNVWIHSRISATLNWIEFDTAEMWHMNWALELCQLISRCLMEPCTWTTDFFVPESIHTSPMQGIPVSVHTCLIFSVKYVGFLTPPLPCNRPLSIY